MPAAGPQLVSTATSAASTAGALAAAAMFVYSRSWRDGEPPGRDEVDELRRRPPLDP
jgi:hypothetical protein